MSNSGEFSKMDGQGNLSRIGNSPALGRISLRAQHMVLYPMTKTLRQNTLFVNNEGEINQEAGDIAIEYNSQSPASVQTGSCFTSELSGPLKCSKTNWFLTCDPRARRFARLR